MANKKMVNDPVKSKPLPLSRVKKNQPLEITDVMKSTIDDCKKSIEIGCTKTKLSREVYDALIPSHSRKQIIFVYVNGIGLTPSGSATYFQNCKSSK